MKDYHKEVKKVLYVVLIINIILASIKILFGYYAGILSISADGYDSLLDAIANLIAIAAVYFASKPKSSSHPYGYDKIENFASILIGISLLAVSIEILTQAVDKFIHPQPIEVNYIAFIIMIITLIINITLSYYEKQKAKELKSDLLLADSNHTKSDVLVTSIVIIALILMYFDLSFIDPVISVLITLLILKTAVDIFRRNFAILLDVNMINKNRIMQLLADVDGIIDVHNIRTRGTTSNIYVDMHMVVDSDLTIKQAHDISEYCEERIINSIDGVKEVLIHLESIEGLCDKVEL